MSKALRVSEASEDTTPRCAADAALRCAALQMPWATH